MDRHQAGQPKGGRRFRIWVSGRLGEGFAKGFGEDIEQRDAEEGTLLTGAVVDQSQVYGILDHLRQLGVEVHRFETYREEEEA